MLDSQFTVGGALCLLLLFVIAGVTFMFGKDASIVVAKYAGSYFMEEDDLKNIVK